MIHRVVVVMEKKDDDEEKSELFIRNIRGYLP